MDTTVALTNSLRAFVDEQVAAGGYASADEYIRDLIRRDRERQMLRRLVLDGAASGPGEVVDNAWFDGLRAGVRGTGRVTAVSKAIRLRPLAGDDIRAVVAHYRADSGPGIALAFTDALQRLMVEIGVAADPGAPWPGQALDLPGLRAWRVPRFPHVVLALERPDHFDLLRVLHAKRDLPAGFAA